MAKKKKGKGKKKKLVLLKSRLSAAAFAEDKPSLSCDRYSTDPSLR